MLFDFDSPEIPFLDLRHHFVSFLNNRARNILDWLAVVKQDAQTLANSHSRQIELDFDKVHRANDAPIIAFLNFACQLSRAQCWRVKRSAMFMMLRDHWNS